MLRWTHLSFVSDIAVFVLKRDIKLQPINPPESTSKNDIGSGSAIFAQLTAEFCYTLQWATPFPTKIAPSYDGSEPHLIYGSLGHPSPKSKRHLDQFSGFCRPHNDDRPTDRQTDRPHYSTCKIGRIYTDSTVMRPNNNNNNYTFCNAL